uniref:Vacuolar fusion protein MON1 homolog n=1 Tax=Panagrolaimus sp. JU765 TaxID=591449 RepID=A0AC34QY11_9BILA
MSNQDEEETKLEDEEPDSEEARKRAEERKAFRRLPYQIWILSEYGKPIYSSYGNEHEFASYFAIIQVLVKRYEIWGDELKCIQASNCHIHISFKSPLILCIISEHPFNLQAQLDIVFTQVLSMLSRKSIRSSYEENGEQFDIRALLAGVDKSVDSCVKSFNEDPVVFSSGFRILPFNSADRTFLVNLMANAINACGSTNTVFGILVAHRQLVAIVRRKTHNLTASDFNVIINIIDNHKQSLQNSENYVPLCLANFNQNYYLHFYIAFLWNGCGPCLLLLSTSVDDFHNLRRVKLEMEEKISQYKRVRQLKRSLTLPEDVCFKKLFNGELWNFMYKNVKLSQVCCSSPQKPYINVNELQHIYRGYFKFIDMNRRLNNKVKIFYHKFENFTLLSWNTEAFELHCIFSPFVTKRNAWSAAEEMLKHMRMYENKVFFTANPGLLNGPFFCVCFVVFVYLDIMSPPSFADLGKSARDLFTKGYNHGFLKFDSTTISGAKNEVQFKTGASHNLTSQKLAGNVEVQYKAPEYGVTVTEKWNTDNVLGTVLEVKDQFARGLKVTVDSAYTPHNAKRDAVVKTEWANDLLKINTNMTIFNGPVLTLSGVALRQDWLIGVQTKLDLSTNENKGTSIAFGRVTPDYALHTYSNDGREFGASLFHKVHRNLELGANLGWTVGDQGTRFGLATKYDIKNDLVLRAKIDNKSNVAVAATHDLSNGVKLTFTSSFALLGSTVDTQNNKFGVGLEYTQ